MKFFNMQILAKWEAMSLSAILLLAAVPALAGGSDRGGADGQACFKTAVGLADLNTVYDINAEAYKDIKPKDVQAVLQLYFGAELSDVYHSLTFIKKPSIDFIDTGYHSPILDSLFFGCKKIQIAVQNFGTNEVILQEDLFNSFSGIEQALVEIHEMYVADGHCKGMSLKALEKRARELTLRTYSDPAFFNLVVTFYHAQQNIPAIMWLPVNEAFEILKQNDFFPPQNLEDNLVDTGTGLDKFDRLERLTRAGYICLTPYDFRWYHPTAREAAELLSGECYKLLK